MGGENPHWTQIKKSNPPPAKENEMETLIFILAIGLALGGWNLGAALYFEGHHIAGWLLWFVGTFFFIPFLGCLHDGFGWSWSNQTSWIIISMIYVVSGGLFAHQAHREGRNETP